MWNSLSLTQRNLLVILVPFFWIFTSHPGNQKLDADDFSVFPFYYSDLSGDKWTPLIAQRGKEDQEGETPNKVFKNSIKNGKKHL